MFRFAYRTVVVTTASILGLKMREAHVRANMPPADSAPPPAAAKQPADKSITSHLVSVNGFEMIVTERNGPPPAAEQDKPAPKPTGKDRDGANKPNDG